MLPPGLTSPPEQPHYYSAGFSWKLSLSRSEKGAQKAKTALSHSKLFSALKGLWEFSQFKSTFDLKLPNSLKEGIIDLVFSEAVFWGKFWCRHAVLSYQFSLGMLSGRGHLQKGQGTWMVGEVVMFGKGIFVANFGYPKLTPQKDSATSSQGTCWH